MLNRRAFLTTGLGATLAAPLVARAQQPARVPRIGVLLGASPASSHPVEGFRHGLRDLGYVEGQNIALEYRWAEGRYERFHEFATDFVDRRVDVIVAAVTAAGLAAGSATKTIPIVTVLVYDPVSLGLVNSLARPGGNVTGLTSVVGSEIYAKQLELLKEAVPRMTRVAVLANPANPGSAVQVEQTEIAARSLRVQRQLVWARGADDFDSGFTAMTKERAGALLVAADPMFYAERARIAKLAARHRLPAMYGLKEHAQEGGLMSYSADFGDLYRRAAGYVDKILKGANPGDLPIEQPTKFDLVINLQAARALGLTIPPSLMLRADQVIDP